MSFKTTIIISALVFILFLTVLFQSALLYKYNVKINDAKNLKKAVADKDALISSLNKSLVQHGKVQEELVDVLIRSIDIVWTDGKISQSEHDRLNELRREIQKIVDAANAFQYNHKLKFKGVSYKKTPNPCVIMRAIITLSEEYGINGGAHINN